MPITHYPVSASNVRVVASVVAQWLQMLQNEYSYPTRHVHCVGVSLGAHTCGFIGKHLMTRGSSLKRITGTACFHQFTPKNKRFFENVACQHQVSYRFFFSWIKLLCTVFLAALDPAGPFFHNQMVSGRLDSTDALFVDVIHTDVNNPWYWYNMGLQEPIGHVDFYPNGGGYQPGCPTLFDLWNQSFICKYTQTSLFLS